MKILLGALRDSRRTMAAEVPCGNRKALPLKPESAAQNTAQKQAKSEKRRRWQKQRRWRTECITGGEQDCRTENSITRFTALIKRLEQRKSFTYEEIPLYSAEGRVLYESIILILLERNRLPW